MTTLPRLRGAPIRLESWLFEDTASRLGLAGATVDDIGGIGYQQDEGTYWRLTSAAPVTWQPLGSGTVEVTGDKFYRHVQGSANTVWTIVHGLEKQPSVTVVDSVGDIVMGTVVYDTGNQLTITFSAAISGEAYLN